MATTPNRSSLLTRMHRVLKKHYKPIPLEERTVLEHMLFAACLENAHYEPAQQAFQNLSTSFFDWNEVRVTSVKELSEVMAPLPDPAAAAGNIKKLLYSVFETTYSYDLESLKKQSLGQATTRLKKMGGASTFVVGYLTQATLGGHAIPLDRGAFECLLVVGAVTEQEMAKQIVPGLERAISKSRGVEFASLLHQLAADMVAGPYAPNLHKILLEIAPDAKDRLPKRKSKKQKEAEEAAAAETAAAARAKRREAAAKKAAPPKPAGKTPSSKTPAKADSKEAKGAKPTKKKAPSASIQRRKPR